MKFYFNDEEQQLTFEGQSILVSNIGIIYHWKNDIILNVYDKEHIMIIQDYNGTLSDLYHSKFTFKMVSVNADDVIKINLKVNSILIPIETTVDDFTPDNEITVEYGDYLFVLYSPDGEKECIIFEIYDINDNLIFEDTILGKSIMDLITLSNKGDIPTLVFHTDKINIGTKDYQYIYETPIPDNMTEQDIINIMDSLTPNNLEEVNRSKILEDFFNQLEDVIKLNQYPIKDKNTYIENKDFLAEKVFCEVIDKLL